MKKGSCQAGGSPGLVKLVGPAGVGAEFGGAGRLPQARACQIPREPRRRKWGSGEKPSHTTRQPSPESPDATDRFGSKTSVTKDI